MEQAIETIIDEPRRFGSVADYLRFDDAAEGKHEYCDGEILAMAGGTVTHARVAANLMREIGNKLRSGPCEPFGSDLRVGVPGESSLSYPDITVVCGPLEFDSRDQQKNTVTNPRMVLEVLSPSTERFDRGKKFRKYLRLASMEEYVLVSQDEPVIDTFFRQPNGTWLFSFVRGLESTFRLRCLNVEISLAEIYRNVDFPPSEEELESKSS